MEQQTIDMLVNLLASAGGALGGKGSWQEAVGGLAQKSVSTRNSAKALQQLLGGLPAGTSMTASKDGGFKFNIPTDSMKNNADLPGFSNAATENMNPFLDQRPASIGNTTVGGVSGGTPARTAANNTLEGGGLVNPSSSPLDLNSLNLAGLSPEFLLQALQLKSGQEELGTRRGDLGLRKEELAMRLRGEPAALEHIRAQTNQANAQAASLLSKDADKTSEIKNYEYATKRGYKGTFDEWKNVTESAGIKDYEYAVKNGFKGNFFEWKTEIAKAGATRLSLGEKLDEVKEKSKLQGQDYFKSTKLAEDINKHLSSKEVQDETYQATMSSQSKDKKIAAQEGKLSAEKVKLRAKAKFIEDKIAAGGGESTAAWDKDGKSIVWTIRWPSGDVEKFKYRIRD
jgi:hypothetical protein